MLSDSGIILGVPTCLSKIKYYTVFWIHVHVLSRHNVVLFAFIYTMLFCTLVECSFPEHFLFARPNKENHLWGLFFPAVCSLVIFYVSYLLFAILWWLFQSKSPFHCVARWHHCQSWISFTPNWYQSEAGCCSMVIVSKSSFCCVARWHHCPWIQSWISFNPQW